MRDPSRTLSPPRRPRFPAGAVALALLVAASPARAADRIWKKSGGRPLVADQVLTDHYDKVEYRRAGNKLELPGSSVRAIDWGDAPKAWQLALDKRAEQDFENAASLLRAAMNEKRVREWIRVEGPFELAETLRAWGARDPAHLPEAVELYDQALAADPKARIRPAVLYGRAQAKLALGDVDGAVGDLEQLQKEAVANKYGVEWELKAGYERAEALAEAERADEAKRAFSQIERTARGLSEQAQLDENEKAYAREIAGLARLAQGRVLIKEGQASRAESFYDRIVNDSKEAPNVRASALVGKAEALRAQGRLKEAQLALATVRVRFFSARDAVAQATFLLGEIGDALGADRPKEAQLAQSYYLEVIEKYADTRWASRARKKLN